MPDDLIYACLSKKCNRTDAKYSDGYRHYHAHTPYIVAYNDSVRPDVHVVPIDREHGLWANYQEQQIVRYELIRRGA